MWIYERSERSHINDSKHSNETMTKTSSTLFLFGRLCNARVSSVCIRTRFRHLLLCIVDDMFIVCRCRCRCPHSKFLLFNLGDIAVK